MKLGAFSLLLLRLTISYIWLSAGIHKLLDSNFISTFPNTIKSFSSASPFQFYTSFLNDTVLSNAQIFAQLTIWGEILTGIAFLLGFPILLGAISGIFMNLNYLLVATSTPSQFLNLILIAAQFVAYANKAGSFWGLEAKIKK